MTRFSCIALASTLLACLPACYLAHEESDGGEDGTDRAEADAVDAEAEADGPYCPDPARPNADVEGTTPLGPFLADTAVFGRMGGECGGIVIHFLADPGCLADARAHPFDPPSADCEEVVLFPDTWSYESGTYLGTGPAYVSVHIGEESREGEGVATITAFTDPFDPFDPAAPPVVEGEFRIVDEGWDLGGSFRASWCEALNVYCP